MKEFPPHAKDGNTPPFPPSIWAPLLTQVKAGE